MSPTCCTRSCAAIVLLEGERSPQLDEFVVRWQQTTGPVMAKGIEDTAFYRYFRLTALNEVGGDPGRFSIGPDELHAAALERFARHPLQLLASQTHDTKRAGDVRARIGALAGMPERWARARSPLARADRRHGRSERGVPRVADARRRLADRAASARALSREGAARGQADDELGRARTSAHETRVRTFVRSLYENQAFLDDFEPFVAGRDAGAGEHASLGALLLRLTSPGLPDIYQGDAFWSLNLVDPDNRRGVDWKRAYRAAEQAAPTRETMKFHLIRRVLRLRKRASRGVLRLLRAARARPRPGRIHPRRQDPRRRAASSRRLRRGTGRPPAGVRPGTVTAAVNSAYWSS